MPDVTINITRKGATSAQKSVGITDLLQRALHKGCERPVEAYRGRVKAPGHANG